MLQILNNAEIDAQQKKESETQGAISDIQNSTENPVISGLAAHIRHCWEQAKRAKIIHEQQILKNMRQKQGIYEPQKLAAIRAMKSSEVFIKVTDVKCRHAKDWIAQHREGRERRARGRLQGQGDRVQFPHRQKTAGGPEGRIPEDQAESDRLSDHGTRRPQISS